MFFDTIDDLKKSDEIYTEFLNDYIHMGEDLMADFVVLISILRRELFALLLLRITIAFLFNSSSMFDLF